jgi:hypothetical protein
MCLAETMIPDSMCSRQSKRVCEKIFLLFRAEKEKRQYIRVKKLR